MRRPSCYMWRIHMVIVGMVVEGSGLHLRLGLEGSGVTLVLNYAGIRDR